MRAVLPAACAALLLIAAGRPAAPGKPAARNAPGADAQAALLSGERDTLFYPAEPAGKDGIEHWHADVPWFTLLDPDGKPHKRPDGKPLARNVKLSQLVAIQDSLPGLESKTSVGQVLVRYQLDVRHDTVLSWAVPHIIKGDSVLHMLQVASRRAEMSAARTRRLVRTHEQRVRVYVGS